MPTVREMIASQSVFPENLPGFTLENAPDDPVALFVEWFGSAIDAGVLGPQVMTLATVDTTGSPSSRVLLCRDVDDEGRWYFSSDASSRKGRELAGNSAAALVFYWPPQGRQIRVRGTVTPTSAERAAADFLARSPDGRAELLVGRQSDTLDDPAELDEAFHAAQARVRADPSLVAPGWTLYALSANEVEFWQASRDRRHVRLCYERVSGGWTRAQLWP